MPHRRLVFCVSDHTGVTAEVFARSLMSRFDGVEVRYIVRSFINDPGDVDEVVDEIANALDALHVRDERLDFVGFPCTFQVSEVDAQTVSGNIVLEFDRYLGLNVESVAGDAKVKGDLDGETGSTLMLYEVPGVSCERVLLVGCGKRKEINRASYAKALVAAVEILRLAQ